MGKEKFEVAISQVDVASYRTDFFSLLSVGLERVGISLVLYAGQSKFDLGLSEEEIELVPVSFVSAKNRRWLNGRLIFQTGTLGGMRRSRIAVVTLNPRILSNWLILLARRVSGRPTLVWGHVWPRSGKKGIHALPRSLMRRLARAQLTYTLLEMAELEEYDPRVAARVVPNALYSRDSIVVPPFGPDVIYVGRLVAEKRVEILIQAFALAVQRTDGLGILRIVGSGGMAEELRQLTAQLGISERTEMTGKLTDPDDLLRAYTGTFCSVSPGYVGLCATQALGFGRPLVFADAERHAPEIGLLDSRSGIPFRAGSADDLATKILEVFENRDLWQRRAEAFSSFIRESYSTEAMAAAFVEAVKEFAD